TRRGIPPRPGIGAQPVRRPRHARAARRRHGPGRPAGGAVPHRVADERRGRRRARPRTGQAGARERQGHDRCGRAARGAAAVRRWAAPALLLASTTAALAGCATDARGSGSTEVAETSVTVFAAASLTRVFDDLAEEFEARHPDADIVLNSGGSGTLA